MAPRLAAAPDACTPVSGRDTRMIAAIVPAAGRSERMGRPKLILPIAGATG